jgi:hypothetical protein
MALVRKSYRTQDGNLSTSQSRLCACPPRPLEFPDGQIVLLTDLIEGQQATVLQLPATAVGSKLPQPLAYVPLPTTIANKNAPIF